MYTILNWQITSSIKNIKCYIVHDACMCFFIEEFFYPETCLYNHFSVLAN